MRRNLLFVLVFLFASSFTCFSQPLVNPVAPFIATPTGHFTFAVLGDNRPRDGAIEQPPVYKQIIYELSKSTIAFVVSTGDIIDGHRSVQKVRLQFKEFIKVSSQLTCSLYIAIGNHELSGREEVQQLYLELICPKLHYSFNYNFCHFIILDSESIEETGSISWPQLKRLVEDLKSVPPNTNHVFVFVHRPLFPIGPHLGRSLDAYPEERDELLKLFVRYKVDAVFCGHEHIYHKSVHNGVVQYITGGGGVPLHKNFGKVKNYRGAFHHYLIVKVSPEKYEVEIKTPEGYPKCTPDGKRIDSH